MNKRVLKKRLREIHALMLDGVRLYVTRPRGGRFAEMATKLAAGIMKLDIAIALALYHQYFPGPRRMLWVKDVGDPEVREDGDTVEASGTLGYARHSDDAVVVKARYRLSARRQRGDWRVQLLTIEDGG